MTKVGVIEELKFRTITAFYKGFPLAAEDQSIAEFIKFKPNLFSTGFQFPMAVLRESALKNNIAKMAEYCKKVDASIAPHVKTSMSPQIAQWQMESGAYSLTVANFSQARVFLNFGFKRLVIANEVVDFDSIRAIANLNSDPQHEIIFYIDSVKGIEIIQEALNGMNHAHINLFLEIGFEGGRGGVRNLDQIEALAQKANSDPRLNLLGVSGFEGIFPDSNRTIDGALKIRTFCQKIVEAARIIRPFVAKEKIILSAGGSAYFDIVTEEFHRFGSDAFVLLRSGAYVTHDHGFYDLIYPFADDLIPQKFEPAIELWAQVLTQPEPGLAILNLGKRDVGDDVGEPIPLQIFNDKFSKFTGYIDHLNDQHAYLKFTMDQQLIVGDVVGLGISHPCTTFDKWRLIPLINDDYDIVDVIHTFF